MQVLGLSSTLGAMLSGSKETQLKLYLLLILADGKFTKEEEEIFNDVCDKTNVDEHQKEEVVKYCTSKIDSTHEADNSAKVIGLISKTLDEDEMYLYRTLNMGKRSQLEILWNMINIAYADSEYSDPEKRVIDFMVGRWEVDDIAVAVLVDTAETILALTKQKEWLMNANKPFREVDERIKQIDKDILKVQNDIKLFISDYEE